MRLATAFIFFSLLTFPAGAASLQAAPEPPSNMLHTADSTMQALERLHERAESQVVENDFEGAIKTYGDILLLEPDDEMAYAGMGTCYLLLGQYRNAHDAYKYALSINPDNETAILGLQKILDPDGVEGMVHPAQIQAENENAAIEKYLEGKMAPVQPVEPVNASKPAPAAKITPVKIPKPAPAAKPRAPKKILALGERGRVPVAREHAVFVDPPLLARSEKLKREKPRGIPIVKKTSPALKPRALQPAAARMDAEEAPPLPPMPEAFVEPVKSTVTAAASTAPAPPQELMPVKIVVLDPPKNVPAKKEAAARKLPAAVIPDFVDAREIQKALRNTGFYSGPVDGILGPVSRNAIKEYQVLHELVPDGVVGPKTWSTLRLYLDKN